MKRQTILYIDPLSYDGHVVYNKIQIKALTEQGFDLICIFREGYIKKLDIHDLKIVYEIPSSLFDRSNGIKFRLSQLRILRDIKHHIKNYSYDKILISGYETFSLLISGFPSAYIINHDNIQENRLKKCGLKLLDKKFNHIVLSHQSENFLRRLGCKNINYLNHGLIPAGESEKISKNDEFWIFSPSAASSDPQFIDKIIKDEIFQKFLSDNKIHLFIRTSIPSDINNKCITILNKRIDDDEYRKLMVNSDAVLIAYGENFKYRVSGVLMEAISYDKNVIIKRNEAINEFEKIINSDSFFNDIHELKETILLIKKSPDYKSSYIDKSKLQPDYGFIK